MCQPVRCPAAALALPCAPSRSPQRAILDTMAADRNLGPIRWGEEACAPWLLRGSGPRLRRVRCCLDIARDAATVRSLLQVMESGRNLAIWWRSYRRAGR